MKWILVEISYHFTSKINGSLVQIDKNSMTFHIIDPDFICIPCWTWHGFWTSSTHGISMTFAKKMMGFPMRIRSHFPPNCRQKDMMKSMSHFLQGSYTKSEPWWVKIIFVECCVLAFDRNLLISLTLRLYLSGEFPSHGKKE